MAHYGWSRLQRVS